VGLLAVGLPSGAVWVAAAVGLAGAGMAPCCPVWLGPGWGPAPLGRPARARGVAPPVTPSGRGAQPGFARGGEPGSARGPRPGRPGPDPHAFDPLLLTAGEGRTHGSGRGELSIRSTLRCLWQEKVERVSSGGTGPAGTRGQPPSSPAVRAGPLIVVILPARPDHHSDDRHDHRWSVRARKAPQIGRALPSTPFQQERPRAPAPRPVPVPCSLQRALHREPGPARGGRLSHRLVSAQECGEPPARDANSHRSDGKVGQGVEKWDKVGYGGAQQTTGVAGLLPLRHSGLEPSRGP
jgi:hypothetical protein